MKVLVTGGNGFIGSHLVEALIAKGFSVTCIIKEGEDLKWIKGLDMKVVYGDVTRKSTLGEVLNGYDCIYHLAAVLAAKKQQDYFRVNYEGSRNIIDLIVENKIKIKRFIFISSIAAGGPTNAVGKLDEYSPANPISDYGRSKLAVERYLESLSELIPWTILRLPVMYGPRDTGALFNYFKFINRGIKPLLGRGESNICYVKDAVRAMLSAAESEKAAGRKYLVAQKGLVAREEIALYIQRVMNKKVITIRIPLFLLLASIPVFSLISFITGRPPVFNIRNYNDLKYCHWRYSTKNIENELGFEARFKLAAGLLETYSWYKDNGLL